MAGHIQRAKHLSYRLKTWIFHRSILAQRIRNWIWKKPPPGVVRVLIREARDISTYFDWSEIEDPVCRTKLQKFTERYAQEPDIVYHVQGDLIIEPKYGLAINKGRQFVRESGTLSHVYLTPGLLPYLRQVLVSQKYTYYESLIHCDGFAGINLCHFIYDTINPVIFLFERGLITTTSPVLVSEKVYSREYFQYVLKTTFLGTLNWVVQKADEWIRVKEFRKAFVSMEIFRSTRKILEAPRHPHRKVFLDRKSFFQRNIRNIDRVTAMLKSFGFELIFAEDLSYLEQVALFRQVKWFVGIHGAGLTNLIHSDIPSLRVLEIFSESLVNASYYRFLKILGIAYYDALAGSSFDFNQNFVVDERALQERLNRLVGT